MTTNQKKGTIYRLLVISVIISCISFFFYKLYSMPNSNTHYDKINIDKNVNVEYNVNQMQTVNLSDYTFKNNQLLDTITISKKLDNVKIDNPSLNMELYSSIVQVYLDGEQIYSYGQDIYDKGEILGHEYINIPIKSDFQGKELKIKITFTEKASYSSLPVFSIMNESQSFYDTTTSNLLILFVSSAMALLGVIAFIISVTRKEYSIQYSNVTLISLFCINISVWMMTSHKIITLFLNNFQIISFLEYFALYSAPIPVLLFFGRMQSNRNHKKILAVIAAINTILCLITLFGFIVFKYNYVNMIEYFHLMMIIGIIAIFYCSFHAFKHKRRFEKILIYGILFMTGIIFLDILRFNIDKYIYHNKIFTITLVPLGILLFVISMIYSYSIYILQSYHGKKEKEILEVLAYRDMLTGLNNRTKCEEFIDMLENTKQQVTIVNYDLNNLKQVNDNFGHHVGDEMLKNFSMFLKLAYSDIALVGRMGGDEFIAIAEGIEESVILERILRLNRFLSTSNKANKQKPYIITSAVGYAIRKENESKNLWTLYEEADKKMYAIKKAQKKAMAKQYDKTIQTI